jgi:dynein heavy chain 2
MFLRGIHLPKPDKYGTVPLVAFLQQLIEFKGFYDEQKEFLSVERIHLIASTSLSSAMKGTLSLDRRYLSLVRIGRLDEPDNDELLSIFSYYLRMAYDKFSSDKPVQQVRKEEFASVAQALVEFYCKLRNQLQDAGTAICLRDATAWLLGIQRYDLAVEQIMPVLVHEAKRIFRDRIPAASAAIFDSTLAAVLRPEYSGLLYVPISARLYDDRGKAEPRGSIPAQTALPLQRQEIERFRSVVERCIQVYEREEREMGNLVLFPDFLRSVAAVSRAITTPGGSMLLVGRPGTGRRSAVCIAAQLFSIRWFEPTVNRQHDLKGFSSDVKRVLAAAGIAGEQCVFYVEDHHVADDAIVEVLESVFIGGNGEFNFT